MVVRGAKYPRKPNEFYQTPPETTRVLLDQISFRPQVVDPACGACAIINVLVEYHYDACGDDIARGYDFLMDEWRWPKADIVMNPPFGPGGRTAVLFVRRALQVCRGKIAVLLPVDFDSGITRRAIFGDCPQFAGKIVLLNRVRWFNDQSGNANHCWAIWDWAHKGPPTIKYGAQNFIGVMR